MSKHIKLKLKTKVLEKKLFFNIWINIKNLIVAVVLRTTIKKKVLINILLKLYGLKDDA